MKQKYKIDAKFRDRILVPYAAIEDSFEFIMCSPRDNIVIETNDGRQGKLKYHKEVNLLSAEGLQLISDLFPSYHPYKFLSMWYARCKGMMSSLDFQYIELNELNNVIPVPAETD